MSSAVILCAGYGTRLKEHTKQTPKPMLLLSGKPILEYTIRHLAKLDINNIFINLHYRGNQIKSYFKDGNKWGVNISYRWEKTILGTAGAVKNMEDYLKDLDIFLVLYGDVICNEDYRKFIGFHRSKRGAAASIIIHKRQKSNSIVKIDRTNMITDFIERPDQQEDTDGVSYWVNSGLYVFDKKILEYIPSGQYCDFPRDIFPKLVSEKCIYGYPLKNYRCSIDSPDRYKQAQNDLGKKYFINAGS